MKNQIGYALFATLFIGLFGWLINVVQFSGTSPVYAALSSYTTSTFAQFCSNNPATCKKVDFQNARVGSVSCPSTNQTILNVYVHAGNNGDGGNAVYVLPDNLFSYVLSNNDNTATVTALQGTHDISWIGVVCGNQPTATPTPTMTPTPTATPTATPTPTMTPTPTPESCEDDEEFQNGICIHIDCSGGGECEVIIGDTPTPTPTVTVTPTPTQTKNPTPTPTPGSSIGGASDNTSSGGIGGASTSTPSVLGATTLAPTGTFAQALTTAGIFAGMLMVGLSTILYAKQKAQ